MPRVRSEKRSRSIRVSKKPYEEYDLPEFKMQTRRRITYFDRVMVGFFSMLSFPAGREISLDDLIQTITEQAESNEEVLGNRMGDYIETALRRLSRDRFITDLPEDENGDMNFMINPDFRDLLSLVDERIKASDQFTSSSVFNLNQYRAICTYFHDFLTNKRFLLDKSLTKSQMERSTRHLAAQIDVRTREFMHSLHPGANVVANPSNDADCTPDDDLTDDMDIDNTPQASGSSSSVQTPPRKSATLNQIGAYPSPMSLPRRGTSGEAHSESSLTPLRSDSMPRMIASGSLDEAMEDLDTAMETEPIPVPDPSVPLLVSLPLSELSEGNWTNDHISSAIASFSTANQEWIRGAIALFKDQNLKARSTAARVLWDRSIRHVREQIVLKKATASGKLSARTWRDFALNLHRQVLGSYIAMGQYVHRNP